jgi:hypothetical protein
VVPESFTPSGRRSFLQRWFSPALYGRVYSSFGVSAIHSLDVEIAVRKERYTLLGTLRGDIIFLLKTTPPLVALAREVDTPRGKPDLMIVLAYPTTDVAGLSLMARIGGDT